jgi:hypothetical protein
MISTRQRRIHDGRHCLSGISSCHIDFALNQADSRGPVIEILRAVVVVMRVGRTNEPNEYDQSRSQPNKSYLVPWPHAPS